MELFVLFELIYTTVYKITSLTDNRTGSLFVTSLHEASSFFHFSAQSYHCKGNSILFRSYTQVINVWSGIGKHSVRLRRDSKRILIFGHLCRFWAMGQAENFSVHISEFQNALISYEHINISTKVAVYACTYPRSLRLFTMANVCLPQGTYTFHTCQYLFVLIFVHPPVPS